SLAKDRQLLLDLLPGGLIRYNASTLALTFINENMLNNLGYDQDTFRQKCRYRFDLMIPPEDRMRVLEEIQEQLAHGDTYTSLYSIERIDGSFCTVYSTGHYTSGPRGGEIYANLMEVPHITEKKPADVL
ncbi:MAG: PAS domain-containing protein, partial [Eubacterium sp.]